MPKPHFLRMQKVSLRQIPMRIVDPFQKGGFRHAIEAVPPDRETDE